MGADGAAIPQHVRAALVCPVCRGTLSWLKEATHCRRCGRSFAFEQGIPLLAAEADGGPGAAPDRIDDHKREQAAFFGRDESADFERARPHGAPALYGWLLAEKFRRSVDALPFPLAGASALVVCGGSGMDAEFLARAGARVITSDISAGAARRARERALRHRLTVASIVADAERLPLRDGAVDLVYVHDGLHHLERPAAALAEMARVAGRAVSVTEPARAGVTAVAVRLGLALEREESGNRVARLSLDELMEELSERGLEVVRAERYGMYYRHEPGRVARLCSRRRLFPLARGAWVAVNRLVGPFGNKLTVQAVR